MLVGNCGAGYSHRPLSRLAYLPADVLSPSSQPHLHYSRAFSNASLGARAHRYLSSPFSHTRTLLLEFEAAAASHSRLSNLGSIEKVVKKTEARRAARRLRLGVSPNHKKHVGLAASATLWHPPPDVCG